MKVPRYEGLIPSSELASRIKGRVRHKNTTAEILLRKELWRKGLRYRLHSKHVTGKPDLVFSRARVVVFCDGDFWHGRNWIDRKRKLAAGSNSSYWISKIESNIARDARISAQLHATGWLVIRVWESEISANTTDVASRVAKQIRQRYARAKNHSSL